MAGLIKEGEEMMKDCEEGAMCDAGIIAAGQKVEHYEIAAYGTARTLAELTGKTKVAKLLQATLDEEKETDERLTELASSEVKLRPAKG